MAAETPAALAGLNIPVACAGAVICLAAQKETCFFKLLRLILHNLP
jgi:hypothetical protein